MLDILHEEVTRLLLFTFIEIYVQEKSNNGIKNLDNYEELLMIDISIKFEKYVETRINNTADER